jgi:hypothetical protein
MSFPWDSVRIVLNVKKTLPLLVVAIIIDIIAFSVRPDAYLFWLGLALIAALTVLVLVQFWLIKVERQMALRSDVRLAKLTFPTKRRA